MYTYRVGGILITDELYHDDLESMTFGRKTQDELWHHGIKGMQWDKRRFQNEDGTLTMAGRQRYGVGNPKIGMNVEIADTGTGNARAGAAAGQRASKPVVKPGLANKSTPNSQYNMNRTRTSVSDTGSRPASRNSAGFVARDTARKVGQSAAKGRMAADRLFSNVRDAVTTASGNVAKTATDVYNDASKWANQAGQDIAKTATDAYNGAGKWVNQAGQDIAKTATDAYNGAKDFVGDTARDVGNWVDQNITGNSARNAANAMGSANGAQIPYQFQQKADNSLFGRIGNAAKDVGNWVTGAYNDASKWVGNAAGDVAKTATNAYNGARDFVGDTARDVGNWVDQNITGNSARNAANAMGSANGAQVPYQFQQKADNSLFGRIGNAAKDVGDWAKGAYDDASKWVSNAAGDVAETATNAYNGARDWVNGAYNDVRDFVGNDITGLAARNAANNANAASAQAYQNGNEHLAERLANEAGRQQNIADNSLLGRVGNWATNAYGDARDYINKAGQNISTAAGNVGKVVTDAYNLASNYSSDPTVRAYLAQMSDPNMDPAQKAEIANVMTDYINSQKRSNSVANAAKAVGSAAKDLRDQVTNYQYDPQVQYYQSMLARPDLDPSTRVDIEREMNSYIDSLKKR